MIRLHLAWAALPVSEDDTHTARGAAVLNRSMEVYRRLKDFTENMTFTVEDGTSQRDELERQRASANYVLYLIDPMVMGPKTMVDLVLDLQNRPKRTVLVLCRHGTNDFIDPLIEVMITHLLKIFESQEIQYCDSFNQLLGFLETHVPVKPQEA